MWVSRSKTTSETMCCRATASHLPSGENRNVRMRSEVKFVSRCPGEPSRGCSQTLPTPSSTMLYVTAVPSGVNEKGSAKSGRGTRNLVDAADLAFTSMRAILFAAAYVAGSVVAAISGIHLPSGEKFRPPHTYPLGMALPSTSSGGPPSMGSLIKRKLAPLK